LAVLGRLLDVPPIRVRVSTFSASRLLRDARVAAVVVDQLPTISDVSLPRELRFTFRSTAVLRPYRELHHHGRGLFQAHPVMMRAAIRTRVQGQHQRRRSDDGLSTLRQSLASHDRGDRGPGAVGVLQRPTDLPQRKERQSPLRPQGGNDPPTGPHQGGQTADARGVQSQSPVRHQRWPAGLGAHVYPGSSSTEFLSRRSAPRTLGRFSIITTRSLACRPPGPPSCKRSRLWRTRSGPRPQRHRLSCHAPDDHVGLACRRHPERRAANQRAAGGHRHGRDHVTANDGTDAPVTQTFNVTIAPTAR